MSLKQISPFFNYSKWYSILEVQYSKLESKYLLIFGSFDTRSCQTTAYSILEKIVFDLPLLLTTLISREKLSKKIGKKTRENVRVLSKLNFGFDAAKTLTLHLSFIFQNQDCQKIWIENRDPLKMRLESWRKSVDFPHKQGWSAETLTIRIGHQRPISMHWIDSSALR